MKNTTWICCLAIFLASESARATPCDDAKEWLRGVSQGGVGNASDAWNQLKPWVSGNEASCLQSLVNETSRDEADDQKLSDALRKHVFKDVTNSVVNKRRNWGGRNKGRHHNRKRNGRHQTPNGTATTGKEGTSSTKKA